MKRVQGAGCSVQSIKSLGFGLLLLTGLTSGCATDSSDDVLTGEWGGRGLGISASRTEVTVEMPCETRGDVAGPVPLTADGSFEFETIMESFYGDFELYLEGRIIAARVLQVEVSTEYSRPPGQEFVLVDGVQPDFTGYVCLGADRP